MCLKNIRLSFIILGNKYQKEVIAMQNEKITKEDIDRLLEEFDVLLNKEEEEKTPVTED
ncbi:hypothetical protein GCM10026983_27590 [Gracilibacillus alcaliphilus]